MDKFKGKYRIKSPYDLITNQFPRKINGTLEDVDLYIDCRFGIQVFYYGRSILQAYIPSRAKGRNILAKIDPSLVFDIEENDSEILFKFKYKDSDQIIPLLSPKISGASISPFSARNLPQNKEYKIPDEELQAYKDIVAKIPKNQSLDIIHSTKKYLKSLATKKNTWDMIKADMTQKGLKYKEYIHSIGKWNNYIKFLQNEVCP